MPSKNTIKDYLEGGIYHVYNRGINKQDIFLDKKDYAMFMFYLKLYLKKSEDIKDIDIQKRAYLLRKNFYERIDLVSFCLMPNHFHLIIKQRGEKDIADFMKCLMTNYSMYCNKRHNRVGTLFQGRYKAVLIKNDEYLLHLSRYIHLNPLAKGLSLGKYDYSSYQSYLGLKNLKWLNTNLILDYFDNHNQHISIDNDTYKSFVENLAYDSKKILGDLTLE